MLRVTAGDTTIIVHLKLIKRNRWKKNLQLQTIDAGPRVESRTDCRRTPGREADSLCVHLRGVVGGLCTLISISWSPRMLNRQRTIHHSFFFCFVLFFSLEHCSAGALWLQFPNIKTQWRLRHKSHFPFSYFTVWVQLNFVISIPIPAVLCFCRQPLCVISFFFPFLFCNYITFLHLVDGCHTHTLTHMRTDGPSDLSYTSCHRLLHH